MIILGGFHYFWDKNSVSSIYENHYNFTSVHLQVRHQCMFIELCIIFLLAIQMSIPTMASKKSNFDELMVENQRTHMRQNYVVQRGLNDDVPEFDNIGVAYATGSLGPHSDPEELPALIVDYANMIRDDIILLDNSIETRTRKRGNIKMKKFNVSSNCYFSIKVRFQVL